jgi:hypothetical protein
VKIGSATGTTAQNRADPVELFGRELRSFGHGTLDVLGEYGGLQVALGFDGLGRVGVVLAQTADAGPHFL